MSVPEAETARLRLRGFRPDDLDALCQVFGDPEVMKYISGGEPRTREATAEGLSRSIEGWRERGFGLWALEEKATGRVVGYCGLIPLEDTAEIEVAYGLARSAWGRGLAAEAARAALEFGFGELKLERVAAVVNPENVASRRVLEKLGMRHTKKARHYGSDLMYYEIGRADRPATE